MAKWFTETSDHGYDTEVPGAREEFESLSEVTEQFQARVKYGKNATDGKACRLSAEAVVEIFSSQEDEYPVFWLDIDDYGVIRRYTA